MPGSQPPFSLIPGPDQNMEDKSFISVVAYVFIFLFHVRFNSVLYQTKISRKVSKILQILLNTDPGSECVFADFYGVQIISSKKSSVIQNIITWTTRRYTQKYRRSSGFARIEDKTPQGMGHDNIIRRYSTHCLLCSYHVNAERDRI